MKTIYSANDDVDLLQVRLLIVSKEMRAGGRALLPEAYLYLLIDYVIIGPLGYKYTYRSCELRKSGLILTFLLFFLHELLISILIYFTGILLR